MNVIFDSGNLYVKGSCNLLVRLTPLDEGRYFTLTIR